MLLVSLVPGAGAADGRTPGEQRLSIGAAAEAPLSSHGTTQRTDARTRHVTHWVATVRPGVSAARVAAAYRAEGRDAEIIGSAVRVRVGARPPMLEGVDTLEREGRADLLADPGDGVDGYTGRSFGWHRSAIGADAARAQTAGTTPPAVAVIDTGIDAAHPELSGQVRPLVPGAGADTQGHGTFIAGLIAAKADNAIGDRGVLAGATVLDGRAPGLTDTEIAAAIDAAVAADAGVINMSFGAPGIPSVVGQALDRALAADVVLVAASGNSGEEDNAVSYPAAALGGVRGEGALGLSVGAVTPLGVVAPFSTHHDAVNIAAPGAGTDGCPGTGVYSTAPVSRAVLFDDLIDTVGTRVAPACLRMLIGDGTTACVQALTGNVSALCSGLGAPARWTYGEGTSFAAPLVAAGAAAVRGVEPRLYFYQVVDVLTQTAHRPGPRAWDAFSGWGTLDIAAAVARARVYDVTAPATSVQMAERRAGMLAVSVRAQERAEAGHETSGAVQRTVSVRRAPDVGWQDRGTNGLALVRDSRTVAVRAMACDAARNCDGVLRLIPALRTASRGRVIALASLSATERAVWGISGGPQADVRLARLRPVAGCRQAARVVGVRRCWERERRRPLTGDGRAAVAVGSGVWRVHVQAGDEIRSLTRLVRIR